MALTGKSPSEIAMELNRPLDVINKWLEIETEYQ
jgi:hypothetical protein